MHTRVEFALQQAIDAAMPSDPGFISKNCRDSGNLKMTLSAIRHVMARTFVSNIKIRKR